jgi:hypothetical protein
LGNTLGWLEMGETTPVSIDSIGATGGFNEFKQLIDTNNTLTTVTIKGSELFFLGSFSSLSNSGDGVVTDVERMASSATTIHSSLTLIDASKTTGGVGILAGATNTSSAGSFDDRANLNANVTIKYNGLTIKGGSGTDVIENDAKNGIVTDGNGNGDEVLLGGSGAKAALGHGAGDSVSVGSSLLGTNEVPGSALGDTVKFGDAATAFLFMGVGAEAGSTAHTASIGRTNVVNAAAGMKIDFTAITTSSNIVDETANLIFIGTHKPLTLNAAENIAVDLLGGPGVAYFTFGTSEYFIATNNTETAVSSNDAIVKLVGITDIHHATNSGGDVVLHV